MSIARRRTLASMQIVPPSLAQHFTFGQVAVLAVVVMEAREHGLCRKPRAEIASLAGCSKALVSHAIDTAHRLGLVREVVGVGKSAPSEITVTDDCLLKYAAHGPQTIDDEVL